MEKTIEEIELEKHRKELTEKWEKAGLLTSLTGKEFSDNVIQLFENQMSYMINEAEKENKENII